MSKTLIWLAATMLFISGCSQQQDTGDSLTNQSGLSFDEVYAAAENTLARAETRKTAWSNTDDLLRDAKAAFDDGRVDDAIILATEARLQAELALEQADAEEIAWRARVLD